MSNLYVRVDEKYRTVLGKKLFELWRVAGYFAGSMRESDFVQTLLDAIFPDGMPVTFQAANLSLEPRQDAGLLLALRPVLEPGRDWPFPPGCSITIRGFWARVNENPVFMVQDVFEISDVAARNFERTLAVITYQENSQTLGIRRRDNALTPEFALNLPLISLTTREKLNDWSDFLSWKRKLVTEKTRGLRYTARRWDDDALVFSIVAPDGDTLTANLKALARQDVVAFKLQLSSDPWTFRINEADGNQTIPRGFSLGRPGSAGNQSVIEAPAGCDWETPVTAELVVPLSEDGQYQIESSESQSEARKEILEDIPEQGFLSVSAAGDLSLIQRHQKAVDRLRDQGGYAPYLSSYLFDVRQANRQSVVPPITDWFRSELNESQRRAVEKMVAAPDLCLVQGPPGTGKTTVIAEVIMQLARQGQTVLLASQAHTAVDNALERLAISPHLRVIRLGNPDKITPEGLAFTSDGALARYYDSLATYASQHYLDPWRESENQHQALRAWYEAAQYGMRDMEKARAAFTEHGDKQSELRRDLDQAWKALQEKAQRGADTQAVRNRLEALVVCLAVDENSSSGVPSIRVAVPEPQSSSVAHAIFGLASLGVRLQINGPDWAAVPHQRPEMLGGLIRAWKMLTAARNELENDVARLLAAGPFALHDPARAIKLAACESELKSLEEKVDGPDGEKHTGEWRNKRSEIRALQNESASGLNADLYRRVFVDAELWTKPVAHAENRGIELRAQLTQIDAHSEKIKVSLAALHAEALRQLEIARPEPVDESDWLKCQQLLKIHEAQEAHLGDTVRQQEDRATELNHACPGASPDPSIGAVRPPTFSESFTWAREQLSVLSDSIESQRGEREIWEELTTEWVQDLRTVGVAKADWDLYQGIFVPQCNVVAITCNEKDRTLEDAQLTHFDVAIIDEVSKATPLEMLLPLMRARRAILVGDHRQLPPLFQEGADAQTFEDVVDDNEEDESSARSALTRENLERFEKMVTASLFKSHFESADDSIRVRLNVQFRMHPQIMELVNHFYENKLEHGFTDPDRQRAHGLTINDRYGKPMLTPEDHVLWVDTSRDLNGNMHREDHDQGGKPLRTNQMEADLVAHALLQLDRQCALTGWSPQRRRKVGVVSFYQGQMRLIKDAMRKLVPNGQFPCLDVEVNTVIRYQGKEKEIILVSLVRHDGKDPAQNGGQVRRRSSRANVARYEFINVAFSRAQQLLMVFGARTMFESYEIQLPHMDKAGSSSKMVYRDIFNQLERDARLIPASQVMAAPPGVASPREHRRSWAPRTGAER